MSCRVLGRALRVAICHIAATGGGRGRGVHVGVPGPLVRSAARRRKHRHEAEKRGDCPHRQRWSTSRASGQGSRLVHATGIGWAHPWAMPSSAPADWSAPRGLAQRRASARRVGRARCCALLPGGICDSPKPSPGMPHPRAGMAIATYPRVPPRAAADAM